MAKKMPRNVAFNYGGDSCKIRDFGCRNEDSYTPNLVFREDPGT